MTFKNNQVINQKFTDSEIETLKNIANEVIKSETSENVDNKNKLAKTNELTNKNNIQEIKDFEVKSSAKSRNNNYLNLEKSPLEILINEFNGT